MRKLNIIIILVILSLTISLSAKFRAEVTLISKKPVVKEEKTKIRNQAYVKYYEDGEIYKTGKSSPNLAMNLGISKSGVFLLMSTINNNEAIIWQDETGKEINTYVLPNGDDWESYVKTRSYSIKHNLWIITCSSGERDGWSEEEIEDIYYIFFFDERGNLINKYRTNSSSAVFSKHRREKDFYVRKYENQSKYVYCSPYLLTTSGDLIYEFPDGYKDVMGFTNNEEVFYYGNRRGTSSNRFSFYRVKNTEHIFSSTRAFATGSISIEVSPDKKYCIIWSNYASQFFILDPNTLAPSSEIEMPSAIQKKNTKNIKFSDDSKRLIITTDEFEYEMDFHYEKIK